MSHLQLPDEIHKCLPSSERWVGRKKLATLISPVKSDSDIYIFVDGHYLVWLSSYTLTQPAAGEAQGLQGPEGSGTVTRSYWYVSSTLFLIGHYYSPYSTARFRPSTPNYATG